VAPGSTTAALPSGRKMIFISFIQSRSGIRRILPSPSPAAGTIPAADAADVVSMPEVKALL
jgi:hypothetical protein